MIRTALIRRLCRLARNELTVYTEPENGYSAWLVPDPQADPEPPFLYHDFNEPMRRGLRWCLAPDGTPPLRAGTRVLFGCRNDDVMALGRVRDRRDRLYGVAIEGKVFRPSEGEPG